MPLAGPGEIPFPPPRNRRGLEDFQVLLPPMPEAGRGVKARNAGELTLLSVGLGLVIAVVMTAANVYMGLKVGLTVSASIPAAVLGLAAYRLLGRKDARAVNI